MFSPSWPCLSRPSTAFLRWDLKTWMPGTRPGMTHGNGESGMAEQWNKYARTAARKHGRAGRELRPSGTTIDIHSHVAIPEAAAFVKPHLDPETIPLTHFADAGTRTLNAKQEED